MSALGRLLRRFLKRDDGVVSVELVVVFPVVILVFATALEAGVLTTRQAMLEYATNVAVRDLRLGTANSVSHQTLKDRVCDAANIVADCDRAIQIELSPVDTTTWNVDRGPITCRDRDQDMEPATEFTPGGSNQLMLVRVCAVFEPVFPTIGLGFQLQKVNGKDYALVSTSAFVNEPS